VLHLPPLRFLSQRMLRSNPGLLRLWHTQSDALTIQQDLKYFYNSLFSYATHRGLISSPFCGPLTKLVSNSPTIVALLIADIERSFPLLVIRIVVTWTISLNSMFLVRIRLLAFLRIRNRLFTLTRIRIWLNKMIRIHANPDPQLWKTYCQSSDLNFL
jgi:hypothetical protein